MDNLILPYIYVKMKSKKIYYYYNYGNGRFFMLKKVILFILIILTVLPVSCSGKNGGTAFSGFSAVFLNTGKSDCFIIRMDDSAFMIDTGETDDLTKITSALGNAGITRIDGIIITHFDKDHIGCAGTIIRNFEIGKVYAPKSSADSREYAALIQGLDQKNMDFTYVTEDITINTQNGSVVIYAPEQESYADDNAYSLITDVTYKDKSILFTGDATKKRLSEFLNHAPEKEYEIIKMPHHGEYTKSILTLFDRENARYGVITCASDMSSVEDKTITAAEKYDVELLYTYNGDIEFTYSDGGFVKVQ